MRHGTTAEILGFAKVHTLEWLTLPFRFYIANPSPAIESAIKRQDRSGAIAASLGHYQPYRVPTLHSPCLIPDYLLRDVPFDSVQMLQGKYSSPQTRVLVYIPPLPACQNVGSLVGRSYRALSAMPPNLMAPCFFLDDKRFVHLDKSGVAEATTYLTNAVRSALSGTHSRTAENLPTMARPLVEGGRVPRGT